MEKARRIVLSEDIMAIMLGVFILLVACAVVFLSFPDNLEHRIQEQEEILKIEKEKAPFLTIDAIEAGEELNSLKATSFPLVRRLKKMFSHPGKWVNDPRNAFRLTSDEATNKRNEISEAYDSALISVRQARSLAIQLQSDAAQSGYRNTLANERAKEAISSWLLAKSEASKLESIHNAKSYSNYSQVATLVIFLLLLFGAGHVFLGTHFVRFAPGFLFVFFIAVISYLLAEQEQMNTYGFGYAAWAIVLGLLISNTIGTPNWIKPALSTEFYIKTGLVILGAEILFNKVLAIGLPGIFVAWIVTPIVLITTYWFGQKVLKIPSKTLNITISADMSVCGVSAAVATAAACKANRAELTLAIGLSMVFTSVMMIVLPLFINYVGLPEVLGGAWIGGTIDATGAVVAAGAFLGDSALNVAATIKMIQNILIGVIAFGVAVYFASREENKDNHKIGWSEIWIRFPKFILGFIGASIVFSLLYSSLGDQLAYSLLDEGAISLTKSVRGWLFCLAFVSIGLSTNFKSLKEHFTGGKPLILYVAGQSLNLILTLVMAYVMFYLVFPSITAQI
jgi:uncharacterized integral membrane protein (TIGR00698 family)